MYPTLDRKQNVLAESLANEHCGDTTQFVCAMTLTN